MTHRCVVLAASVALAAALFAGEAVPAPEKKAPDQKAAPKVKKTPKPPDPFHVWADRIHYVEEKNAAHITGNATIIKGEMRIDADNIIADLDPKTNQFKKLTATGNVRMYTVVPIAQRTTARPPLQLVPDGRSGTCDKAIYDATTETLVLLGTPERPPVVFMGKDRAQADLITHDRAKGLVTFEGHVQLTALLPVKGDEPAPPPKGEPAKKKEDR